MAHHGNNAYRKKQVVLCILVFVCIGIAFYVGTAAVAVGAILAACAICLWAASMEPERAPDEHHHH
ncbi:MAG: hypothetical protein FJ128_13270 [Deltaproteobacteria bacterium]|nr:hypothetical protein [Deltaproteobacteria bacterium]